MALPKALSSDCGFPNFGSDARGDDALRAWMKQAADLQSAINDHAIVAVADMDGRITFVNDQFCAISKYSREELIGQDYRIINSGQHSRAFFRELWGTITRGKVWHGDILNRAKDGASYCVATTIVPILAENGKPSQFAAICADVTGLKRVEAELAEKLRLQRLLTNISALLVALPSSHVDAAVEDALRLIVETLELDRCTLWQREEDAQSFTCSHSWQAHNWPTLPPGFILEAHLPWLSGQISQGKSVRFSSLSELPPEADTDTATLRSHWPKSLLAIPLSANGHVFGVFAFATLGQHRIWREDEVVELNLVTQIVGNVLARQRAEIREEQVRGELAHAMRVATLGELVAALAHELNQPLAAILSNAQAAARFLARDNISKDELCAILADIVRDDKRAGSVIHNLRGMISKKPATRESCCMNELVREALELMHAELIAERIEVRTHLAIDLPPVDGARVELQQVLVNLVLNAVHAMKATPEEERFMDIETRLEPGVVAIRISDRGHGIPPERLPNVFAPFYSTKPQGLGMGLSICRRIIENHAGRLDACNREDGGACFWFSVPILPGV